MIKERFLHYKTMAGFQADIAEYGEEALYDKIVFIQEERLIWTHGTYYCEENWEAVIPVVTDRKAGLMTPSLYLTLLNLNEDIVPLIKADVKALQDLVSSGADDITEIVEKFLAIVEFIDNLGETDDGQALLSLIIQNISDLDSALTAEVQRAKKKENYLQELINNIRQQPSGGGGDGIRHIFLTQEEYDSLEEYERDTIYFILEPSGDWVFGSEFPIILT